MARKRKGELPSGNIRIKVYDHTNADGKKIYKSFTASTRNEALALAAEWKDNRRELKSALTVAAACWKYIDTKKAVLSAYTVSGYESALRRISKYPIAKIDLKNLSNQDVQLFVSELSLTLSPKTVKNTYNLLSVSVGTLLPNLKLNVTLPQAVRYERTIPTSAEIQLLLDTCDRLQSFQKETKLAIILAAMYTLRRGEACALTFSDVDYKHKTISINKAIVQSDGLWLEKQPKTYQSYRTIIVSDVIIDAIKDLKRKDGYVLAMNPDQLEKRFNKVSSWSGVNCRYHDLRHYAASSMHSMGIPQRYIEEMGGWRSGSKVLTEVYQHTLDDDKIRISYVLNQTQKYNL